MTLLLLSNSVHAAMPQAVLCLELDKATFTYDGDELREALQIRLPEWNVRFSTPDENSENCTGGSDCRYFAEIEQADGKALVVQLKACDGRVLVREQIKPTGGDAEVLRACAITIALALDLEQDKPETLPEDVAREPASQSEVERGFLRTRPVGSAAIAPGIAMATRNGDVAFGGFANLGLLFENGIWLESGFKLATPFEGTSDKESTIGVADRAFWLGGSYRIDWVSSWFVFAGLAAQYVHVETEDLSDNKYEIEEISTQARWSLKVVCGLGYQIFSFLAVSLRIYPGISFGERAYKIRGSVAVELGYFMLDSSLGLEFYF